MKVKCCRTCKYFFYDEHDIVKEPLGDFNDIETYDGFCMLPHISGTRVSTRANNCACGNHRYRRVYLLEEIKKLKTN